MFKILYFLAPTVHLNRWVNTKGDFSGEELCVTSGHGNSTALTCESILFQSVYGYTNELVNGHKIGGQPKKHK